MIRVEALAVRPLEGVINIRLEVMMNIDAAWSRGGPGSEWMARKKRAGADGGYYAEKIPPGLDAVFAPFRVVRMVIIFVQTNWKSSARKYD